MGRDCHRLDGHRGGGGGGAISSSKSKRKANAANGCMAAFYHLFDFQSFYFPSHHHLTIDSSSKSKVLKLVEESPPSTTYKEDKQSVSMRVRTETETETKRSRLRALTIDASTSSSEICNSPGSKTPNLVARLMGLDLLPEKTDLNHPLTNLRNHYGSSRLTRSQRLSKKETRSGTRSLPESPRISSARKSDFDIHRLSLQLNKENKHEEFGCSRLKLMKQDQEESRSPRDYARQIVKQIKERVVTRRVVGMDITNSVKNREARPSQNSHELRRDTAVSCSPRTRKISDKENKPSTIQKADSSSCQIIKKPKPKPTTVILVSVSKASGEKQNHKRVKQKELRPINKGKKAESETRFSSSRPLKSSPTPDIRSNPRESFLSGSREAKARHCSNPLHKKRSKKIPKSNDLNKISATGPPQKQRNETKELKSNEDESICSTLMQRLEENAPQVTRNYKSDDTAKVSASSFINSERIIVDYERDYISKIMKLAVAGINTDSLVSSATMLDPSIFRELEHSGENQSGSLAMQWNRRLLFDLVNEILIETVKRRRNYHGSELIGELCSAVSRCSSKSGSTPGEIALMDVVHLLETKKAEEEGEEIIAEIEREMIDALVRETASELIFNQRRTKTTSEG